MSLSDGAIAGYHDRAAVLAQRYDDPALLKIYDPVRALLPEVRDGRLALDVGAGAGRDAAWLVGLGYQVVAVEPAAAMRAEGMRRHGDPAIRWLDDRLPALGNVHGFGLSFDLILLSAVWQHVAPADRPRAFRKLVTLMKPGALLLLSLRHGPAPPDRPMFQVSLGEIEALARLNGLELVRASPNEDGQGRSDVSWTHVVLKMPDDGTGALPLIRGIILADDKSSTYKLALLRTVARIAEAAPAAARIRPGESDSVELPLGLVALTWIRMFLPLVRAGLPQAPRNSGPDGLGFAKVGFRSLMADGMAPVDLRIGAVFTGDRASAVAAAIGEAAATITNMPANFTRFPGSDQRVFGATRTRAKQKPDHLILDLETLRCWGRFTVPGHVWRALTRLGSWVEPVLVAEWARLMRSYGDRMGRLIPPGQAEAALGWEEPLRDTTLGRAAAARLAALGQRIDCVWSGVALGSARLDIDHCLPWSAWPCGDLWNLLPSDRRVNQHQKRDRLPSFATMADARPRILAWWQQAWLDDAALGPRFAREVAAALPTERDPGLDDIYAALEWRRLRLRQDQQVPEWTAAHLHAGMPAPPVMGAGL
jgi:hypothetical protein